MSDIGFRGACVRVCGGRGFGKEEEEEEEEKDSALLFPSFFSKRVLVFG